MGKQTTRALVQDEVPENTHGRPFVQNGASQRRSGKLVDEACSLLLSPGSSTSAQANGQHKRPTEVRHVRKGSPSFLKVTPSRVRGSVGPRNVRLAKPYPKH